MTPPAETPTDLPEDHWTYDGATPDDRLEMRLDPETVSLPRETFTVSLGNAGEDSFLTNPYDWRLHRHEDGVWHHVGPTAVPEPVVRLAPGDRHEWTVTVDNTGLDDPDLELGGRDELLIPGLGGGHYAFGTDGWFEEEAGGPESPVLAVGRFAVEGPALDVTPSGAVESTERDGDSVTVTIDAEYGRHDRRSDPATLVVERLGRGTEAPTVVAERLIRTWPERDAFAAFEPGVRTVRVETTGDLLWPGDEERHRRYDGVLYRLSVERGD
jgi:hypothetical protein